ncbi:glycosyltransferase involved in cell wall biosynthesis [Kineosphaera limosa]|uniref:Putative glycosyltransferase n=1 Tax=Kineosphaera limosa NBRC 100340 TaxID=1184609 RepID=K6WST2_9MICO|nr:glycosyltransferase [Kineosphaera limosa]NYE01416.1 glycosyltransferase involved in cell wall biosynthesis [Kineosphaera limosa]GAB95162.1 putative glycosyltransferase [Kineosphaera limosa NBRC 100340]
MTVVTAHPPTKRLVIVVRADPVICGHSGEARCLAEVALTRGYDDVRIVTWPIDRLEAAGLPLKPLDHVLPYSAGITVERPGPVGDYRVPDGRWLAGLTGRLIEIVSDGVPTVVMSLYLSPHTVAVEEAVRVARSLGRARVTTIAEAVGSDVTNIVRACVESDRFGAAAHLLSVYLGSDHCVAVSQYTKDLIVGEAATLDALHGTSFAQACRERVGISYPAVDSSAYLSLSDDRIEADLAARGLTRGGYALYLSRIASAKGLDDLIEAYAGSRAREQVRLVLAGRGPQEDDVRRWITQAGLDDRIVLLTDVGDDEKPSLMAGSAAYVLPTRPQPEFVETFGIALVESMLAGGGPVITCPTGGVPEAVGDTALMVPPNDPAAIRAALDAVVCDWSPEQLARHRDAAREFAVQFDRANVFDRLFARLAPRSVDAVA